MRLDFIKCVLMKDNECIEILLNTVLPKFGCQHTLFTVLNETLTSLLASIFDAVSSFPSSQITIRWLETWTSFGFSPGVWHINLQSNGEVVQCLGKWRHCRFSICLHTISYGFRTQSKDQKHLFSASAEAPKIAENGHFLAFSAANGTFSAENDKFVPNSVPKTDIFVPKKCSC